MKKLLTCAGVAVVGAASVHAQFVGDKGSEKPWSVSAKLRGFYDSNYLTKPENQGVRSSWGTEFAPSFKYNLVSGNTSVNAGVGYSGMYYEDRPRGSVDHTIQADIGVGHSFNERLKVDLADSFVRASEPTLIEPTPVLTLPLRTEGSANRNLASASGSLTLTEKLGVRVRYQNVIKDYDEDGNGKRSALLDSMDNSASADLTWAFSQQAVGLIGYQFQAVEMTSKDRLLDTTGLTPAAIATIPTGNIRDYRSHFVYGGVEYSLSEKLNTSLRGGMQFTEYPNQAGKPSSESPYGELQVTYRYMEGSSAQFGLRHSINSTDISMFSFLDTSTTLSAESTTIYGTITQKITPTLNGILRGQWQGSEFNGGSSDGKADNYYSVDLSLSYKLPEFWKFATLYAEAGYSYDKLQSDITNRGFDRNRIFFGFRGTL